MEFLKNIFGDRKPEYADRIPERLTATNFDVHDVSLSNNKLVVCTCKCIM